MQRAPRPGNTPPTDPRSVRDIVEFTPAGDPLRSRDSWPIDPATGNRVPVLMTPDELDMTIENQFQIRRNPPGPGFLPSEKKVDPRSGRPERDKYESPFEDEVSVQYDPRPDGTVRRGTEWNMHDSEGAVMKWGDPAMDQEYIVTMAHESDPDAPVQRYYIFGSRVYDLTAAEAAGEPADFREFPTSLILHRGMHDDGGDVLRAPDGKPLPPRKLSKSVPEGKIGEEWLNEEGYPIFPGHRGADPHDRVVISRVETRGGISPGPLPLADRPNRGNDPFDAVDGLIPLAERTAPRRHPEHRSDDPANVRAARRRRFGHAVLHFVGAGSRVPEHAEDLDREYPRLDTHEGRTIAHNFGHEEWERMDIRERRDLAEERVYFMINALAEVSTPEIETHIKIFQPRLAGRSRLAHLVGLRRSAVDPAQVAKGQINYDEKTDRSVMVDETVGWVLPFRMEGDQINIKTTSPNRNRDADLIIEKPAHAGDKPRSWMGGVEVKVPGVDPVRRDDTPRVIGVGSRMGSYGQYGEDAIERWTRSDKPEGDNTDVELTKLIKLANDLYAMGQRQVPPIEGLVPPHLRPDFFGR